MAIRIVIANAHGGTGKTTTSINIADALAHCGYRVLLLDWTAQPNASTTYRAQIEDAYTFWDVLTHNCSPMEAIQHTQMGDIIAGAPWLAKLGPQLATFPDGNQVLKNIIDEIELNYDFIIIDTMAETGIFLQTALIAASGVIIPITADKFSLNGLRITNQIITNIIENFNSELCILGVLMTAYDKRNSLDKELWEELPLLCETSGLTYFDSPIHTCQAVCQAQAKNVSLFEEYPTAIATNDYLVLANKLLAMTNSIKENSTKANNLTSPNRNLQEEVVATNNWLNERRNRPVSVMLPASMYERLSELAFAMSSPKKRMSVNEVIVCALANYIETHETLM